MLMISDSARSKHLEIIYTGEREKTLKLSLRIQEQESVKLLLIIRGELWTFRVLLIRIWYPYTTRDI